MMSLTLTLLDADLLQDTLGVEELFIFSEFRYSLGGDLLCSRSVTANGMGLSDTNYEISELSGSFP